MDTANPCTILIVDDQTLMREGLETILDLEDDLQVIGTASNGLEAIEKVSLLRPQLVLMDIQMPVMNGIDSIKEIKKQHPDTRVLILTTFQEDDYIVEGLANGADGYLIKDIKGRQLITSIREALAGQMMMPAVIAAKLAARLNNLQATAEDDRQRKKLKADAPQFSNREQDIIREMLQGRNNRQIAAALFMSEGTVRNYISVIYQKLGVNDRAKAIVLLQEYLD
ncbi:MAG TPA: response regulator transcription factor [Bacilli bacterium]|nr:response regulator transcription factor [Bacilli bacterium]